MKIGVFGGSFNPIHNGHIQLTQVFSRTLSLDKVLVIPASFSPFKQQQGAVLSEHRLAMCRLAFENLPFAEVSNMELKREGPSYTYLTLQTLTQEYPGAELFLMTGADSFLSIQQWKHPEVLFACATICAAPRNQDDAAVLQEHARFLHTLGARTALPRVQVMTVSSTQIRESVRRGESIRGLVPLCVEEYIYTHGLYLCEPERNL